MDSRGDTSRPPADSPDVLERFHAELGRVEFIARQVLRTHGRPEERDDVLSAGREGLLDAARRYDPAYGISFGAYVNYRVRGAMVDCLRQTTVLSRRAHEHVAAWEAVSLANEGHVEEALASAPPTSIGEAHQVHARFVGHIATMATAAVLGASIAEAHREGEDDPPASSNPEEAFAKAELLALVRSAVNELAQDQAEVIRRYYFEGQRIEDVARDLAVTKGWVSRLHTRAVARLTKRLRQVF